MDGNNPLFGGAAWMGVCYSPYHQANQLFGSYTKDNVDADLAIVAHHYNFIRTYTVQYANQYTVELANKHGLGVALGAWIFQGNSASTNQEIDTVLSQASQYPETVKCIVVGNEVDLQGNNYSPQEVQQAVEYAKSQKANYPNLANTPVTICFTGTGPMNSQWNDSLKECESYVFLTIYPWYAPNPNPSDINGNMQWSYNNGIQQAEAQGLTVVIAEIGWPSDGDSAKETTPQNELTNYQTTCSWINGGNFLNKKYVTMWFEMFDEPWKTNEGAWGPHWGLYSSGVTPVPKFSIPACN